MEENVKENIPAFYNPTNKHQAELHLDSPFVNFRYCPKCTLTLVLKIYATPYYFLWWPARKKKNSLPIKHWWLVAYWVIMAQQTMATVRNPPPRMLSSNETLYSLGHWITGFRTYYRRDSYYKGFLLPLARWNSSAENYGQLDDISEGRVVCTALDKSEDLKDFLNTIVGFLPFPYLTHYSGSWCIFLTKTSKCSSLHEILDLDP